MGVWDYDYAMGIRTGSLFLYGYFFTPIYFEVLISCTQNAHKLLLYAGLKFTQGS